METATLGAGCFWCVEAIFSRIKGVTKVLSGYSGGHVKNPTYEAVCQGNTGHAEVIQVTFDPKVVPFTTILQAFWKTHDPTTKDRQGDDVGPQYRSVIFYHSEQQRQTAAALLQELSNARVFDAPIVTEISPFKEFYQAEDYHHDYYANNSQKSYCALVITPKVEKFEKAFRDYLKR